MKINNKEVEFKEIAYDGCHKIYLIQDEDDKKDIIEERKSGKYEI